MRWSQEIMVIVLELMFSEESAAEFDGEEDVYIVKILPLGDHPRLMSHWIWQLRKQRLLKHASRQRKDTMVASLTERSLLALYLPRLKQQSLTGCDRA